MGGLDNSLDICIAAALWVAIGLFCWQYREYLYAKRQEKNLREHNKDLGCFAYAAAHDLKAPLRTIIFLSDRLQKNLHETLSATQEEDIILLRQRARRMEKLIDDLLEYWQAGRRTPIPDNYRTDLDTLIKDCTKLLNVPAHFTIAYDRNLSDIVVYQLPLQQIISNILGNAIKHHDKPFGNIQVRVVMQEKGLYFCIDDDGPGIAPKYRDKVFDMFETLKSRDEVEGSGMGLALVKRLVEREGGRVWIEESVLGGASVRFTWPHRKNAQGAGTSRPSVAASA